MPTLLAATTNQGKRREIQAILAGLPLKIIDLTSLNQTIPSVAETGATLAENAMLKAKIYSQYYNLPTLADDSGLFVDALAGRPGVHSARYAGSDQERNEKLLAELKEVPPSERTARFVCCAAYVNPGTDVQAVFEGKVEGEITDSFKGRQGFGFDPVFYYPPFQKTFAELTQKEKNRVSHRQAALKQFKEWWDHQPAGRI